MCGGDLNERKGLVTSVAFAIKIPSDSHFIFLFKVTFDNLEPAQFFFEDVGFLLEVQIVPHSYTVDKNLCFI